MTLSTDLIRSLCTGDVFDRGVSYYEDGRVERLERFGETMTAAVRGSQPSPYEVEIEFEDGADATGVGATCSCPYDWDGYCKHVIAVLLAVKDDEIDVEDERETVERVLSDAHFEELRAFLLEECERNADLRRRLLASFEEQDTRSVYDYRKEIRQQYRGPYAYRYEGPDFDEFHDLAAGHRTQGNPLEAATIYRAMTEARIENMDVVRDYYDEDFDEELDAFVACVHEADLDHDAKREYVEYLFERWESDDGAVETFAGRYEDALWELCTEEVDLRYWRSLLEDVLPAEIPEQDGPDAAAGSLDTAERYRATRRLETYADLLDALGDDEALRALYGRHYFDDRGFCLRYARLLNEDDDTDRAIEIAEEGLDAFSNNGEIRRFLIDAYADRDPERRETLVREQFSRTGNWTYYEQLRSLCSDEEWANVVAELEAEFEGSNVRRLIELYLREGRTEAAFETVVEDARTEPDDAFRRTVGDNGLTILSEYREEVADHDRKTYYERYEERLEPFLADTTGRDHYRTVVEYLEEMRELGFDEAFEAFVAHLKEKHSNRPAFLDEMEALEDN
jgi:hypothetical protein